MKKIYPLALICLLVLYLSQLYWLFQSYTDFEDRMRVEIATMFLSAIDNEVGIRLANKPKNPDHLSFTIKRAADMTPEERASLHGDTINLDQASKDHIGTGLSDIFKQVAQDQLADKRPINLFMLDSLFQIALSNKHIPPVYQITLFNKQSEVIQEINHDMATCVTTLKTELYPIGLQEKQAVQADVCLPPFVVFRQMAWAFSVSFSICLIFSLYVICQLRQLKKTQLQLKEREEAMYGAVHDLKRPLNGTFTLLDYLIMHSQETSYVSYLQESQKQILRLVSTIESMLTDLKNEYHTSHIKQEEVDVPELIQHCWQEVQTNTTKQTFFRLDNPDNISWWITDRSRLERCIGNLLENAVRYSDDPVTVIVSIRVRAASCEIIVQDNGWGIPEKKQRELGKAFYRVRTNKSDPSGYGLGLNSVIRLIREMDGQFSFTSQEHVGSSFQITLPKISKSSKEID